MAEFTPSLYGKYVSASILRIIRLLTFIFFIFFFGSSPPTFNLLIADWRVMGPGRPLRTLRIKL